MKGPSKGALVLAIHLAIVLGIAAKARYDRETLPHVWVKTVPVDPEHPLLGRYVRLWLQVEGCQTLPLGISRARLVLRDGRLCAEVQPGEIYGPMVTNGPAGARLSDAVMYYIPEHVPDPSRRPAGEELWVEVAVSEHGIPRPVRLGVKSAGGEIRPLDLASSK